MNGLSIIIPITNRAHLLDITLISYKTTNNLSNLNYEIIILSRNSTDNLKEIIAKHSDMNIKLIEYQYGTSTWINPAHAFNVGAYNAKYNIIALTSPEIKHESPIITELCKGFDTDAVLIKTLDELSNKQRVELYSKTNRGDNPGIYFFGAYKKDKFISIGGIDEDFMQGVGFEDTEIGERWLRNGFTHNVRDDLICVHQYHPRGHQDIPGYKHNEQLYSTKKNQLKANQVKLCGFIQVYNELEKGNLKRCINNLKQYCDYIAVFDDASTDGSGKYCEEQGCDVLFNDKNAFIRENYNKQALLEFILNKHKDIDWIITLDADEILNREGTNEIKFFCSIASNNGYSMKEINLWRSDCWHRNDYLGQGEFVRLWRNDGTLKFTCREGLHVIVPPVQGKIYPCKYKVIHYGYSTQELIERRWIERTKLGVPKSIRIKGIQEEGMELIRVPDEEFPLDCLPVRTIKPVPIKYNVS